jgi:hypothetical protein
MTITVIFLKKGGLVHADQHRGIIGYFQLYDQDSIAMELKEVL